MASAFRAALVSFLSLKSPL